ncbi:Rossmann-like and DUF2520 domain-containing protein [Penaeicola halotolerans]|uniref:Rossmann-like and DUF2520 domain-containing protein n=1 Tax=Penaeicola halotolerans TaxID=2793196 RepID=UPI001CF8BFDB|nr:Rossmann-like and DUF2520 domain-containing protein [Penaeicola halotolerans]
MYYQIALIGSGNVAWHLAPALEAAGHTVREIYSKNPKHAEQLVGRLYEAEVKSDLDFSESDSEIFIIAVSDSAISAIADSIILPEGAILVHTSGSTELSALDYSSASYTGIFYPLQTFSKAREMSFDHVPILLEADDDQVKKQLKDLAKSISQQVYFVNTKDRKGLHVAAVFASNFTNHMIRIAEDIMRRQGLDFEMLKPLIIESISKSLEMGAANAQTGPARRNDLETMDKHYQFLQYNESLANIYRQISQDILDAY